MVKKGDDFYEEDEGKQEEGLGRAKGECAVRVAGNNVVNSMKVKTSCRNHNSMKSSEKKTLVAANTSQFSDEKPQSWNGN